jgi:hypothetical protein
MLHRFIFYVKILKLRNMKKHNLLFAALLTALFLPTITAQTVLPSEPFGTAFAGANVQPPAIKCPNLLVGYVNFEYAGAGATPANWSINDIQCYGPAIQTITTNRTYTSGSVFGTANYSIVKNPSTMTGGTFQNINAPGGFFVTHNGGDKNTLVYTIKGLNSPADYGISGNDMMALPLIYYVRIKLHNFGTQGGCNALGNNVEITFDNQDGNSFSLGNSLFYDASFNRGQNGRYMASNSLCSGANVTNQGWGGWGQLHANDTKLGYDGTTAVFEGAFGISAGKAGQNPFGTDNGFRISIKSLDDSGDNIFGIESIEVYGCLPMKIEAKDGRDGTLGNTFCENGPVDISATGTGFGNNITWKKGNTLADAIVVGQGHNLHVTAPQGVGNSDLYWAVGEYGTDTVRIYSVFCCSALGQTAEVFKEDFPINTAQQTTCGTATISSLTPGRGTTTYNWTGNNDACKLDENEYAIANHSYWSFWNNRTQVNEHTNRAGSGMLMVNGSSNTSQFFYEKELTGLCPSTQYEFSAWYASIAAAGNEGPSNITFEITNGSGAVLKSESTGQFGGTANSAHNSSYIWRKKTITFVTDASTTGFWVKLRNNESGTSGNDLLIDDISVIKCVPTLYLYEGGTTNTSVKVCSPDNVNCVVEITTDMLSLVSGGSNTLYVQLMGSDDEATWTAVAAYQIITQGGVVTFSITPPTGQGAKKYYRVKLSADMSRCQDVNAPLTGGCYNDVITQTFDITKDGTMGSAAEPTKVAGSDCTGNYYTLTGTPSDDAEKWGWAYNDTTGMTYGTDEAAKQITATANGTYLFVYKNGDCAGIKTVQITDIVPATEIKQDTAFTICSSELPYTWRTETFPLGQTSNTFVYSKQSVNGCDSTVTLNLTVEPSNHTKSEIDICADKLPYTYHGALKDTVFNASAVNGTYIFRSLCSTDTLDLTIAPQISTGAPVFEQNICADAGSFTITIPPSSSPNSVSPSDYTIEFAGNTQSGVIGSGGIITVALPSGIYPAQYSCKITLSSGAGCNELVFDKTFDVYYPTSIMEQKWDDVIALLNSYFNGGYEFAAYQWYKNGGLMPGETRSYIYVGEGNSLVVGDLYWVDITRADGSNMRSCPFEARLPRPEVTPVPVIATANGVISINFAVPQKATVNLWSITGVLLKSTEIYETGTIGVPSRGSYLLEIVTEQQQRTVQPIVY